MLMSFFNVKKSFEDLHRRAGGLFVENSRTVRESNKGTRICGFIGIYGPSMGAGAFTIMNHLKNQQGI